MLTRRAMVVVFGAAAALVLACGGSSSSSDTPSAQNTTSPVTTRPPGGGGAGSLIITKPEGLIEYDIASGNTKVLIPAPTPDTFVLDPAISRDGTMLAYVAEPPPKIETSQTPQPTCPPATPQGGGAPRSCGSGFVQTYDAGSDLWVANRDGTNPHAVFTHTTPNQLVRFPQWEDAGHILAIFQEIDRDDAGITSVKYVLERVDISDGSRTTLLENALSLGVSPDSTRAAYAELPEGAFGETLDEVRLPDATDKRTLVPPEQNLSPFNFPRYSPDGTQIAFASADQTGARAQQEYVSAAPLGRDAAPPLDGLPEDIWTMDAAGGAPRRVADLKEDLPALSWNGTGDHVYAIGSQALYDINLTNGAVDRIGEGSFHAQLVWVP